MKLIFLVTILLATLSLTSCGNNENISKNSNITTNEPPYSEPLGKQNSERISYKQYIEKYNLENENMENTQNTDDVVEEQMENIPANQLATFSTPLLSSPPERINNLKIVCERLNNYILEPNETFSYNNVTGPFGKDDGFQEATILLSDGSKTKGYGGGVCQLSSTLYNVVKNIENIDIIERHNHSSPVAYVPENEDATVSLQSDLDFKFMNNNDYPIRFEAVCSNDKVLVKAFKDNI